MNKEEIIKKINSFFEKKEKDFACSVEELSKQVGISKSELIKIITESSEYRILFDTANYSPESGPMVISKKTIENKIFSPIKKRRKNYSNYKRIKQSLKIYKNIKNEMEYMLKNYSQSFMLFDPELLKKSVELIKYISVLIEDVQRKIK